MRTRRRKNMSYKQLSPTLEQGGESPGKSSPAIYGEVPPLDKVEFPGEAETELSAEEDTQNLEESDKTLLIADESEVYVTSAGDKKGAVLLSVDTLFELDSWRYRYTRRALIFAGLFLLLGLVSASITLIALSPTCPNNCASGRPSNWSVNVSADDLLWWQKTVIYQAYPRSFQDSDGDGNGDLNGIRSRLDHFIDIGVSTVWLNPIYPSPHKDNGYDISNYTGIDPLFGNLTDFKALLSAMHDKGLRLILDFIPNHSSEDHPWFKESRSSRNSSKRDWYIWADGKNGGPPNNWISVFGGSAWKYDNTTGQYYYHAFGDFQPDLNYRNQEVKEAMENVLRFWLDLGVDGFRVDAVIFLLEDSQLRNETRDPSFPSQNCTTNITNPECYNSLIHNLTTNYEGVHEVIRSWRDVLDSYSEKGQVRFMVGEVYDPINVVVTYYDGQFDFPFNFILLTNSNWTGTQVSSLVSQWLDGIPEGAWSSWVLGNHDNPRIANKAGIYLARALNVLLLTLPGTPTTYYGEEILMTDVYVPPPERHDVSGQGRDKERTPMQWNTSANAGFTLPNTKPWLPLATNYTSYNVEVESKNSHSSLSLYQELTKLRFSHPALLYTGYQRIYNSTDIYAYLRSANSTEILVVINFSVRQRTVDISGRVKIDDPTILLSSNLNRTGSVKLSNVSLMGGEALLITTNSDC